MLNRFLPEVIRCWEESVLPSKAIKFISASWKFPSSMKVTPSFQILSVWTIDMSSILDKIFQWSLEKSNNNRLESEASLNSSATENRSRANIFKLYGKILYNAVTCFSPLITTVGSSRCYSSKLSLSAILENNSRSMYFWRP